MTTPSVGSPVKRRPRLLIIGHARHGKDTVAELISTSMGLKFSSSSLYVAGKVIWPHWGAGKYATFSDMFDDRSNHRAVWHSMIAAYCTPDKTRTATEMMDLGNDMYVGMRAKAEFNACMEAQIFDHVIWVDAGDRFPDEGADSMGLIRDNADLYIDNSGSADQLVNVVEHLQVYLNERGFEVGVPVLVDQTQPEPGQDSGAAKRLEWEDRPENSIQVLDHGFFQVKEVMCSDKEIAESARMSYGRGTKTKNPDSSLIKYLVLNGHTSPLEMGEIRFHMRLPIFVMRQLVRHRTANLNEYSGRYSEMVRLFYVPENEQIMCQGLYNKQMSGDPLEEVAAELARESIAQISNTCFDVYEELLKGDVSRETARMVLPLNTYTEVVWKLDVSNLVKFLYLRDDDHAQWEIRVYAKLIGEAVERFFPLVYAAYLEARDSTSLTENQIRALITGDTAGLSKSQTQAVLNLVQKDWANKAFEEIPEAVPV